MNDFGLLLVHPLCLFSKYPSYDCILLTITIWAKRKWNGGRKDCDATLFFSFQLLQKQHYTLVIADEGISNADMKQLWFGKCSSLYHPSLKNVNCVQACAYQDWVSVSQVLAWWRMVTVLSRQLLRASGTPYLPFFIVLMTLRKLKQALKHTFSSKCVINMVTIWGARHLIKNANVTDKWRWRNAVNHHHHHHHHHHHTGLWPNIFRMKLYFIIDYHSDQMYFSCKVYKKSNRPMALNIFMMKWYFLTKYHKLTVLLRYST